MKKKSAQAFRRHVRLNILERQGANFLVAFHQEKKVLYIYIYIYIYIYKTYDATNQETTKHNATNDAGVIVLTRAS